MTRLEEVDVTFDLGTPFSPLTQLMAVLPEASSHCVPPAFAQLMNPSSILGDFYPKLFELDPNGKPVNLRWLWVARLPFIDAPRLLEVGCGGGGKLDHARVRINAWPCVCR